MDAVGAMELSAADCLSRLRSARWGRVALSMQTIAMVVPVPVRVVEDRVVFTTVCGSAFDRAVQGQPISVQVEGREPAGPPWLIIGGHSVFYKVSDLDAWIARRAVTRGVVVFANRGGESTIPGARPGASATSAPGRP